MVAHVEPVVDEKVEVSMSGNDDLARDGNDDNQVLEHLAENATRSAIDFLGCRLQGAASDIAAVGKLNDTALHQHDNLAGRTVELSERLQDLAGKYCALEPYLQEIDELELSVEELEGMMAQLGGVVGRLEARSRVLIEDNMILRRGGSDLQVD